MKRRRTLVTSLVVAALLLAIGSGFKREYALPAYALLDLKASRSADAIIVTGALRGSSAKVVRTTATHGSGDVLIRVYAHAIKATDDPRSTVGTFTAVVPLGPSVHAVLVGDGRRFLTVGRLWGLPIRLPRLHADESAVRLIWNDSTP